MLEDWWEPWCIDVPQTIGHSHVGTLNGSCGVGAGKNRKWEIWVKSNIIWELKWELSLGWGWCHSQVKTSNGCISVGGGCHGPADVSYPSSNNQPDFSN